MIATNPNLPILSPINLLFLLLGIAGFLCRRTAHRAVPVCGPGFFTLAYMRRPSALSFRSVGIGRMLLPGAAGQP